jgi:hypothetical protein
MTKKDKLILLGKIVTTIVFLLIDPLEITCIRQQSSWQTAALWSLAAGSALAFVLYWFLWVWFDAEKFINQKYNQLLRIAVIFSGGRFLYMDTLCPHHGWF